MPATARDAWAMLVSGVAEGGEANRSDNGRDNMEGSELRSRREAVPKGRSFGRWLLGDWRHTGRK
jgi:hypothetical protein